MTYDAVIVGASVAGLYAGMKLSERNWRVCIVDRRSRIGLPVRCGQATGNRAELARFVPIDESWIVSEIKGLTAHVNDTHRWSREIPGTGVILHRERFEQHLAEACRRNGVDIRLNTLATGLPGNDGKATGVTLENGTSVDASFVIGADGAESSVGRWAGITQTLRPDEAFSAAQYSVQSDFCNDGLLHFFIGSGVIPKGYVWVFPMEEGRLSLGAGLYGCHHSVPKAKHFLDAFLAANLPGVETTDLVTGCAPLAICPKRLHKANVLVIGDAARQCNPMTVGGIMNALEATDLAVHRLLECGTTARRTAPLSQYSAKWARRPRKEQKLFLLIQKMALSLTDEEMVRALSLASKIFRGKINRERPFSIPILRVLRLLVSFFPRLWRFRRILAL